jgi:hypothetical protein
MRWSLSSSLPLITQIPTFLELHFIVLPSSQVMAVQSETLLWTVFVIPLLYRLFCLDLTTVGVGMDPA